MFGVYCCPLGRVTPRPKQWDQGPSLAPHGPLAPDVTQNIFKALRAGNLEIITEFTG
jgi:hypothetical protein